MEVFEPPCVVKDVISHIFLFDNLQNYLTYLEDKNKRAFATIYDLTNKVNDLMSLRDDVRDINNRFDMMNLKQEEMNDTLNHHSQKIMDLEVNETEIKEKLSFLQEEQLKSKLKIQTAETNIIFLTKYAEDTTRNIEKVNMATITLKSVTDNNCLQIEKNSDKINQLSMELDKYRAFESVFNEYKLFSLNKIQRNKEKRKIMQKKTADIELNLSKLYDMFNELAMEMKNKRETKIPKERLNGNRNNIHSSNNQDIANSNFDFTSFLAEYKEFKTKFETFVKDFQEGQKELKHKSTNIKDISQIAPDEVILKNLKKINKDNINNEIIVDNLNLIHDNLNILSHHLTLKASKDDLNKLTKHLFENIEKIQEKSNDFLSKIDSKIIKNVTNESPTNEKNDLIKMIEKTTKEYIFNELNILINDSFLNNSNMKSILLKVQANIEEIAKLAKIVEELKYGDNDLENEISVPGKPEKTLVRMPLNRNSNQNYIEVKIKLVELENSLKCLKELLDQNLKGTIYEDEDEKFKEVSTDNIKDFIKNVYLIVKNLMEKVEKVSFKQESMNTEILGKVKKDLSSESNRILDEFRGDLKVSIGSIEEQLREKVDRFNLDEFGKRMDTKFNTEISKKIDKFDLKKNNVLLNKKFDNFENKISKTLVDTLIDLQMEEAPLITVKKGAQADKCGSCNQIVLQNPSITQSTFGQHIGHNLANCVSEDSSRFKLRAIQDISNKFGTGSYSRILNNINTDTLNEELKINFKSLNNQLPHIKNKSNLNSPKRKNPSLGKIEEFPERTITTVDEEKKMGNDIILRKKEKKK